MDQLMVSLGSLLKYAFMLLMALLLLIVFNPYTDIPFHLLEEETKITIFLFAIVLLFTTVRDPPPSTQFLHAK
jgi:hypothetical protein